MYACSCRDLIFSKDTENANTLADSTRPTRIRSHGRGTPQFVICVMNYSIELTFSAPVDCLTMLLRPIWLLRPIVFFRGE